MESGEKTTRQGAKTAAEKPRTEEPSKTPIIEEPSSSKSEEASSTLPADMEEPKNSAPSTNKKGKKPKAVTVKAKPKAPAPTASEPKLSNRSVLQLKITLDGITPPIWRRIQVLNNITFEELRDNINEAMGWRAASRSHQFIIQNPKKPDQNILIVNGVLGGLTYDFNKERGRLLKEQNTKVSRFLSAKGTVILYEYDLAESWIHKVVLERILPPPSPKAWFPKIKGGKRACPPEDCGGVDGYNHLVEVFKNPEHEEYDELIQNWLFEDYPEYDPEKFERKNIFKKVWMWVAT